MFVHRIVLALPLLCALGFDFATAGGFKGGIAEALGPRFDSAGTALQKPRPQPALTPTGSVRRWNQIAVDASGVDHTPVAPGEARVFGEQLGPGRASRAMAIVHVAMFDAMNALGGPYRSYTGLRATTDDAAVEAAIAQAAHDTLAALYPSQGASFDALLADDLAQLGLEDLRATANGSVLGASAAAAILALRANDGSQHAEPRVGVDFIPGNEPGKWRQDPVSLIPLALGARWGAVQPLVIRSGQQFRVPPPPALASAQYAAAFDEVKRVGGDGAVTPALRSAEQTRIGLFWAYDGVPSLCAPPRLYNQIAMQIAEQKHTQGLELARLLALVNLAMADAGIAIWESKYHYQFWRPVTGIREADADSGPSGAGDGNPDTFGDPTFTPMGAPASNLAGPNFTPPFPAYPSGHAGFGAALFQVLRRFYRTDAIAFTFVSDELNGITRDHQGNLRPLAPRSFKSLSQAEEENGQSRMYLGIHWAFDKTEGIVQGRRGADYVFERALPRAR